MKEFKHQLTNPVKTGEYVEIRIDVVGADYSTKTIELKINWEIDSDDRGDSLYYPSPPGAVKRIYP